MHKQHHPERKKALVCVTNGSEDVEFVTIVDTLRRAPNIDVTIAKVFAPDELEKSGTKQATVVQSLKQQHEVHLM